MEALRKHRVEFAPVRKENKFLEQVARNGTKTAQGPRTLGSTMREVRKRVGLGW